MLKLTFAFSVALLVFLLFYAVIQQRKTAEQDVNKRLNSLMGMTYVDGDYRPVEEENLSFRERVLVPFKKGLDDRIARMTPRVWEEMLERKLMLAGLNKTWSVGGYAGFWFALIFLGTLASFSYISKEPTLQDIVWALMVGPGFGAFLPNLALNVRIQKRKRAILRQLPEMLDLLCVSVYAGLTFDAAVSRIVKRLKGPLIDECVKVLEDMRMGIPQRYALRAMADRCDVSELTLFITSVIQAERLGTSMANTLANQADNMRERRRQQVKAQAMKAPIKMLFPLVIFIFPTIFIVVLLPSVLNVMRNYQNVVGP